MTSPDPNAGGRRRRSLRRRDFFRFWRTPDPEPAPSPAEIAAADLEPWPGLRLLRPVSEDELIAFGRDLEATPDVVAQLLADS